MNMPEVAKASNLDVKKILTQTRQERDVKTQPKNKQITQPLYFSEMGQSTSGPAQTSPNVNNADRLSVDEHFSSTSQVADRCK